MACFQNVQITRLVTLCSKEHTFRSGGWYYHVIQEGLHLKLQL